jgi:hypothetical protein
MPLRRRKISRELAREETRSKEAARELVGRIVTCFVTDPDLYDVKAAVLTRGEKDDLLLARLAWTDDARWDYFHGDPWAVVRGVVEVPDAATGGHEAEAWIGGSIREVPFNLLPGLFQEAYVACVVQPPPPSDPLGYWWVVPGSGDDWPVRIFPSGIGDKAPPIGEVGYVLVPREAIEELWRLRGW